MSDQAAREARGVGISMLTLLAQVSMPAFHVLLSRGLGRSGYGLYAWSNMLVEMLSVVIQVGVFKYTKRRSPTGEGKRFFKMAPIHHHFQKLGWPETKVVLRFWVISLMCALAGLATLKLR